MILIELIEVRVEAKSTIEKCLSFIVCETASWEIDLRNAVNFLFQLELWKKTKTKRK